MPDPLSSPTAARPWTAALAWAPDQNAGLVSMLHGRIPVTALVGQALAGDDPAAVAADFDVPETTVRLLLQLRDDLLAPLEDPTPEPQFVTCGACERPVDRLKPHVVLLRQIEVVRSDLLVIDTTDSTVTALFHRDCAEAVAP